MSEKGVGGESVREKRVYGMICERVYERMYEMVCERVRINNMVSTLHIFL